MKCLQNFSDDCLRTAYCRLTSVLHAGSVILTKIFLLYGRRVCGGYEVAYEAPALGCNIRRHGQSFWAPIRPLDQSEGPTFPIWFYLGS